ncbi:uncharacterized protein SOCE26_040870 [Sorangium cellulosum]|uniref:Uncharacterized protein n=2 Tax=Sorangium cellulosum TaxID=56 RepID=A0A2L0ETQ2_SORCE|nr:uncharacterized protein SOCE26_040870 [Sorangium cellulosum]
MGGGANVGYGAEARRRGAPGRWGAVAAGFALVLSSGACNPSPRIEDPTSPDHSFVFGHIDLEELPTEIDYVILRGWEGGEVTEFIRLRLDGGTFYAEYVPRGTYFVSQLGSSHGFMRTSMGTYALSPEASPIWVVVDRPGIYYMGSWRYRPVEANVFSPSEFALEPVSRPAPGELLQALLPHAEGTAWETRLRSALAAPPPPALRANPTSGRLP